MELWRSLMFVPGHRERMVEKALALAELDVALLDLEDGVPPGEKDAARRLVAAAVVRPAGGPLRVVRVNRVGSEHLRDDLAAVVRPGLAALLVPKVDAADDVLAVDRMLLEREPAAGLARGSVRLLPSVETAKGLLAAPAIAACPRVMGLLFGAEDFALDLGIATAREGEARELLYARSAVVVAAAAAGIPAFDGIWPDIRDLDGLRRDALQARRLGYRGKSLVHPGQIGIVNEVFSPTPAEVDEARRVVAAFEEARARGLGATATEGRLIDQPIVERARRVLHEHDAAKGRMS